MKTYFKHQVATTLPSLLIAVGGLIAVALVSSPIAYWGSGVLKAFAIAAVFTAIGLIAVIPPVILLVEYCQTLHGRQAYYTMTLPIKLSTVFSVKVIWTYIVSLVSGAISLLGFFIILCATHGWPEGNGQILKELFSLPAFQWISLIVVSVLIGGLFGLLNLYAGITIGMQNVFRRLGAGGAILSVFLIYVAGQLLSLVGYLLFPVAITIDAHSARMGITFGTPIEQIFFGTNPHNQGLVGVGSYVVMLVLCVALWVYAGYVLNRHTSAR